MPDVDVVIHFKKKLVRFTLYPPRSSRLPKFSTLCEDIVHHLRLPISAAVLADEEHTPYDIVFLPVQGEEFPIYDDASLREAMDLHPRDDMHLSLVPVKNEPKNEEAEDDPIANAVLLPSQLIKLYHYLRHHGTSSVIEALGAVHRSVRASPHDVDAMREVRYELAALVGPFISKKVAATVGSVSPDDYGPLQTDFSTMLLENKVSQATTTAIVRSVQLICACRFASDLLRAKYAVVARDGLQDGKKRAMRTEIAKAAAEVDERIPPVKQYIAHYKNMLRLSSQGVRDAHDNLAEAMIVHPADEKTPFTLTKRLCYSIDEKIKHFLQRHVKRDTLKFKKKSFLKLQKHIIDRLTCAGFNDVLVPHVARLIEAFMLDRGVLKNVHEWAMRPVTWDSVSVREREDDEDGHAHARQLEEEIDREVEKSRRRRSRSRYRSRSRSRDSWVNGDDRHGRSRTRLDDSPRRGRADSLERHRRYLSPRDRRNLDVTLDRPSQFDERRDQWDDLPTLGRDANSESECTSSDTAESKWARVEWEKEQEREKQHRMDQADRDRRVARNVSRTYRGERVAQQHRGERAAQHRDERGSQQRRGSHGHHEQAWGAQPDQVWVAEPGQDWGGGDQRGQSWRQKISHSLGRGRSREREYRSRRGRSREHSRERSRSQGRHGGGGGGGGDGGGGDGGGGGGGGGGGDARYNGSGWAAGLEA